MLSINLQDLKVLRLTTFFPLAFCSSFVVVLHENIKRICERRSSSSVVNPINFGEGKFRNIKRILVSTRDDRAKADEYSNVVHWFIVIVSSVERFVEISFSPNLIHFVPCHVTREIISTRSEWWQSPRASTAKWSIVEAVVPCDNVCQYEHFS